MCRYIRGVLLHTSKLIDVEESIIYTYRFCLKKMGDPSSKNIEKATIKNIGDKIIIRIRQIID